jgi:hypothetical protein
MHDFAEKRVKHRGAQRITDPRAFGSSSASSLLSLALSLTRASAAQTFSACFAFCQASRMRRAPLPAGSIAPSWFGCFAVSSMT